MVRAFVLVIATAATLGGCASLGFGPTGYQAGKYTTEEPYEYGYWESCAHALTYSTRCKVYYLASRETEEDAMWHMAIYRAAEVGDDAGFRYLSWSLPKIRPVSKLGFGSMSTGETQRRSKSLSLGSCRHSDPMSALLLAKSTRRTPSWRLTATIQRQEYPLRRL